MHAESDRRRGGFDSTRVPVTIALSSPSPP